MKRIIDTLSAFIVVFFIFLVGYTLHVKVNKWLDRPAEQSSSFVGYSKDCYQIGDTLTVVTARGDTVRFDLSRMGGAQ